MRGKGQDECRRRMSETGVEGEGLESTKVHELRRCELWSCGDLESGRVDKLYEG